MGRYEAPTVLQLKPNGVEAGTVITFAQIMIEVQARFGQCQRNNIWLSCQTQQIMSSGRVRFNSNHCNSHRLGTIGWLDIVAILIGIVSVCWHDHMSLRHFRVC
jgi:hypothetical protein